MNFLVSSMRRVIKPFFPATRFHSWIQLTVLEQFCEIFFRHNITGFQLQGLGEMIGGIPEFSSTGQCRAEVVVRIR